MYNPSKFGVLLKEKRLKANVKQSVLAESINKTAQYISNIEKGKNNSPPKEKDIDKLIKCLSLDEKEAQQFRIAAAADRGQLPKKQIDYILSHKSLQTLIEYGTQNNVSEKQWEIIMNKILGGC